MSELRSCYFCGTPIDDSANEYSVVPEAFDPEETHQTTVVLCPACHRKLESVLDRVVAASRDAGDVADALDAPNPSPDAPNSSPSTGDVTLEGAPDEDGVTFTTDAGDEAATASDRSSSEEGSDEFVGGDDQQASTGPDAPPADSSASDADETSATAGEDAPSIAESSTASGDDAFSADDDAPLTSGDDAVSLGTEDETDDASSASEPSSAPESSSASSASDAASASEVSSASEPSSGPPKETYDRVVKLLRNREFPVQRDEIVTVAASAYDLPPDDVETVIDAAVERGVLVDDAGSLSRPD